MKKLYYLDESEKQRILSLHESHTKKQYLMNEQSIGTAAWDVTKGLALGGIAGAGIAIFNSINSANNRAAFNAKVAEVCGKQGKPMMTVSQHMDIAEKLNGLILTKNWPSGYATNDSRAGIKSTLQSISSIPDLCAVIKEYKNLFEGKDLMNDLGKEFYFDQNWQETVKTPLSKAIRLSQDAAAKAGEKPAETLVGWDKFPCVVKHPKAKLTKMSNGAQTYDINGIFYYDNGRKVVNGTMASYTCNDPEFSVTTTTASGTASGTGGGDLSTRVSAIQKQLGLAQSGKMDQATINAIMGKIQGGSTTTNNPTTPQTSVVS